ncbi:MAG: hypothetical protein LH606_05985 [Cytophagaceae bacterium]|nr:hypothetical protein [Cytophagaceae bacterium]
MSRILESKSIHIFTVLAIIGLATSHFFLIARNAVDLPFADDYHLLKIIIWAKEQHLNALQTLREMAVQHNEHRIIFPRLYTFIDYWIEGRINWLTLTWLADLTVLGFLALFYRSFRQLHLPLIFFLPVALFLFQPQSYDSLTWTISILQQYCVFFWLFLLAVFITKPSKAAFAGALIVAVIAVFTHGNGILGFAWGTVVLVLQRRWKPLGIWLAALAVVSFFYFGFGYTKGQNGDAAGSLADPVRFVGGIFVFCGAFADVFQRGKFLLPVAVGAVMVCFLTAVNLRSVWNAWQPANRDSVWQRYVSSDRLFLMGCFVILLATGFLTSLFRSWGGLQALIQVRYQHMSAFVFILFYLTLLHFLGRKAQSWALIGCLVLGAAFWILSTSTFSQHLDFRRKSQWADAFNWRYNSTFVQYPASFNRNIRDTYNTAIRWGVCPLPTTPFHALEAQLAGPTLAVDSSLRLRVDSSEYVIQEPVAQLTFRQYDLLSAEGEGDNYVILKSPRHTYLVGTWQSRRTWRELIRSGRYFGRGFYGSVLTDPLAPGTYRLGVLNWANGQGSVRFSNQTITR